MQRFQTWIVGLIVVVVVGFIVAFMFFYTVRFNETAVKTVMGEAVVKTDDASKEAGLRFMVPGISSVTKYDNRNRFLESKVETQQTADDRQVAARAFITWKITDAVSFYQRFSNEGPRAEDHYSKAETVLNQLLRNSMGAMSDYRFDELLAIGSGGARLEQLEQAMLEQINDQAGDGIEVTTVGISSLKLPEQVTEAVFERMKSERSRIAQQILSEGESDGERIRQTAAADSKKILSFAETLAARIRSQGEQEAAQYMARMDEFPSLAVFINEMKFMRESLADQRVTLVLDTSMPGMEMFSPSAMRDVSEEDLRQRGIPVPNMFEVAGMSDAEVDIAERDDEETDTTRTSEDEE